METAGKLVVHAAASHVDERALGDVQKPLFVRGLMALEQQINRLRVGEFWRAAKSAEARVEKFDYRAHHVAHDAGIEFAAGAGE